MRFGLIAIVLYMFSIGFIFFGYYTNELFPNTSMSQANTNMTGTTKGTFTSQTLEDITNIHKQSAQQQLNPIFIFGDFFTGLKMLFIVVTGQAIGDALITSGIPGVDWHAQLLIMIIFTASSFFLWFHIITGRDV